MKVVMTHPLSPAGIKLFEENGFIISIANSPDASTFIEELQDADAFVIRVGLCPAEIIDRCSNLKVIARTGVGYDNVDVVHAAKKGIPVVYTPGANHRSVAEHTLALMFALSKNLLESDAQLRKGNWLIRDVGKSFELHNKRVGIIGVGAIGKIVAELCRAFGMQTAGYSSTGNREKVEAAGCVYYDNLEQLLKDCDIITIHNPLTEQTRNMITLKQLSLMKSTALLINTSRGAIVNEQDLADALNSNILAGAAVDIYSVEPATADSPVFSAKNMICTPHNAALTREAAERMSVQVARGCIAVCNGEKWQDVAIRDVYSHERFK